MDNAGVWLRVSTGGQDEANQIPEVEAHCAARGYNITRRYELHDRSAFKGEQTAKLEEMLADVRAGAIRVLVCWHSDRLERRGGRELLNLIAAVQEAGGRVESVREPQLGGLDMGGQVLTFLSGVMANAESAHKADRIRAVHERIRENGALIGRAPFGYTSEGTKYARRLVPTAIGREYVPQIFQRVIDGQSLGQVAAWLNDQGVVQQSCKGWYARTVGTIIHNPVYRGQRCELRDVKSRREYGKVIHECPALVDAATWDRANKVLTARFHRGALRPDRKAMLSGALYCPECSRNSPMYRVKLYNGVYHYRCTGRGPGRTGCGNMVPLADVDAAFERIAQTTFRAPVMVTKVIPGHTWEAELAEVKFSLRQLMERFSEGELSTDDYSAQFAELVAKRDDYASRETTPDQVEEVPTGQTYAMLWEALEPAERGPWLKRHGFVVEACKDYVRLSQPGHPRQLTATEHLRRDALAQAA